MSIEKIQDAVIDEKLKLFMFEVVDMIRDNDEAVDGYNRNPEKMEYQNGFEFVAPAYLSFYWSSGSGTPMHDTLIERLLKRQGDEWARHYPNRKSIDDILSSDDENAEHRSDAEEWEQAALDDECIYIQAEAVRADGDIKFASSFTDEINRPYGKEFTIELSAAEFLAMEGDELDKLARQLSEAPYETTLD